jgi:hypothetical protein
MLRMANARRGDDASPPGQFPARGTRPHASSPAIVGTAPPSLTLATGIAQTAGMGTERGDSRAAA